EPARQDDEAAAAAHAHERTGRLLADGAADAAEDGGDLVTQDDQQRDHDNRDQDQDQRVLDHALASLASRTTTNVPKKSTEMHACIVRYQPFASRYGTVAVSSGQEKDRRPRRPFLPGCPVLIRREKLRPRPRARATVRLTRD